MVRYMRTAAAEPVEGAVDTRQRLIDVAVALFIQNSFAGTSLQMIADEIGFTKAAIYYHFRTREQLLAAVLEPIMDRLAVVVAEAEGRRTPNARAEHLINAYAELAARNRALVGVLSSDPSVAKFLKAQPQWSTLIERQIRLIADIEPGPAGRVKAAMVFAGMSGAAGFPRRDIDDESLQRHLADTARRALGLRTTRGRTS